MLKRKIEQQLLDWKNTQEHKPVIVKGCRQCGKTFSVLDFAKKNYKHVVYLNFFENPDYASVFSGSLEIDNIVMMLSALLGKEAVFEAGKTALILDEIQECPQARTALKFFKIDGRFDVIASGSMLGIHYKEVPSYPVGYVDYLDMYSMDFEEFLWANGISEKSVADLKEYFSERKEVPEAMHQKMMELFKEYIVVGGMPRVVQEFVDTHNFKKVFRIQNDILNDYKDDIAK